MADREYSDEERAAAYEYARERIAEAKTSGVHHLILNPNDHDGEIAALSIIPPEIADLRKLIALSIRGTQVTDLSPLQALSGLRTLDLDDTRVADCTPLQALTGLRTLLLQDARIADLTPLEALTQLQTLNLNNTQVADLAPLQALTGLQTLDLNNTQVADVVPLQALTKLKALILGGTEVKDLTPLQTLTGLQELNLSDTQVEDLAPLQALTGLQELYLYNTQVADLAPLQAMTGLQTLWLDGTRVADLLPLAGLSRLGDGDVRGLWFNDTPAANRDDAHRALAAIRVSKECAKQVLQYLNGEHPEFGGPPEPYRPLPDPYDFASQDRGGLQYRIEGYQLSLAMHSDPPPDMAEQMLPEFRDSVEDLIDTFENPNSVMARGIQRRAKRMQAILENSVSDIAMDAVVLWQASVALGSYMDEHALAVADGADPLDRLSASRMGALQRVIEASAVFVRLFPAAEALDDSRGGFLRSAYGAERVQRFIDQVARAQVLDQQSALFIRALAEIAAREGPQADKARSVTMTGIGTLIRIVTHYGKGAITGIALGVGASIGGEIDDEFQLGINAAQMLRGGEQTVREVVADLAPDVRNAVKGALEEIFGSDVPLPPPNPRR